MLHYSFAKRNHYLMLVTIDVKYVDPKNKKREKAREMIAFFIKKK